MTYIGASNKSKPFKTTNHNQSLSKKLILIKLDLLNKY